MATWVDYKELKQRVRMNQVRAQYGILESLKQKGENLVGPCPIHKGTNATQFHVSLVKNNFNCFGDCHGGGNVLDFVAKMEGLDSRHAGLKLLEWFGTGEEQQGDATQSDHVTITKETLAHPDSGKLSKEKTEERPNPPLHFALKNLDPASLSGQSRAHHRNDRNIWPRVLQKRVDEGKNRDSHS